MALFARVHMKQYWDFRRVTTKQYCTHFSELIPHNTFSGRYYKKILHISSEFLSNNTDTSKLTNSTVQTVLYTFLSNKTDIFRELLPNTTDFFHRICTRKHFFLSHIRTYSKSLLIGISPNNTFQEGFWFQKVKLNIVHC